VITKVFDPAPIGKTNLSDAPIFLTLHSLTNRFGGILSTKENTDTFAIYLRPDDIGLKDFPSPDNKAVQSGCLFLVKCTTDLELFDDDGLARLKRQSFYSIIAKLDDGVDRIHKALSHLPNYDKSRVGEEINEALSKSGPQYCEIIEKHFLDCDECPHYESQRVNSPIKIIGPDFVATKSTGFWHMKQNKAGELMPHKPDYEGLVKYFNQEQSFITVAGGAMVYTYQNNYWQEYEPDFLRAYSQDKFNPKPRNHQRREFVELIRSSNVKSSDWFNSSIDGLINMDNGVYDMVQDRLLDHSPEYGFKYKLPYGYDSKAECPRFIKFLDEVTLGSTSMQEVLMEFVGYSLANGPCYAEKAIILYGSGANGKSTFMDTLKALAGSDNYSSLSLTALNKDTKRYMVDGKLFNIGEETNVKALGDSEVFKTMVTGGDIDVKKLYSQDYIIKNRCKLIMACNELPKSSDRSDGLYRRMILMPFRAKFTDITKDPEIREKLAKELPGIFNLALQGYKRLKSQKWRFSSSKELKSALDIYKTENDNVLQWQNDRVTFTDDDEDWVWKDEVYADYKRYSEGSGNYPINKIAFFREIKQRNESWVETKRPHIDGSRKRIVVKLKLEDRV